MFTAFNHHKGAVLIELMFSIMLSLFLLFSLVELYLITQRNIHRQAALNQIQHHAVTAIAMLRASVHQAGNIGCAKLTEHFPFYGDPLYKITVRNKIEASNNGVLMVRHVSMTHATLVENMRDHLVMKANQSLHFSNNDLLVISDCTSAEVFRVKQILRSRKTQKLIPITPLQHVYAKNSEIARLVWDIYYIKTHTLYLENVHHIKIPIVDGVDEMQIEATVNQEGHYVELPASQVEDWSTVVGLSFMLSFSSAPYKKHWYAYVKVGEA